MDVSLSDRVGLDSPGLRTRVDLKGLFQTRRFYVSMTVMFIIQYFVILIHRTTNSAVSKKLKLN